jgi:ArsR family transcriptional regulator
MPRPLPIVSVPPRRSRARASGAAETRDRDIARLAKAIAHPARVAIVRMLAESGECLCGGIADRLPLAQSTVSQHLKVLKSAGLIRGDVDPPRVCYCIDPAVLQRLKSLVAGL